MRTTAKTKGFDNGLRQTRRQAGCDANAFLSSPCSSFDKPRKRSPRTAGTARGQVKIQPGFDEQIIARYPLPLRVALYAVAVLTVSGILPMAAAALQIWLTNTYGLAAFAICMSVDVVFITWLVRR